MRRASTVCVLAALAACGAPEPSASPDAPPAAPAPAQATTPAPDVTAAPAAKDLAPLIGALKDRQQCNRVTGCPPMSGLLAAGKAATAPLIAAIEAERSADAFWVVAAVDTLGQLGDPDALPTLEQLGDDPRWEVQVEAQRALARLAPHLTPATREALAARLAPRLMQPGLDVARGGARLFALSRLDPRRAEAYRASLVELLPTDPAVVAAMPAPFLDVLVQLVGEARLPRALPAVREAARSDNRFVAVHALEVLGRLQDTGGVPYALARAEDPHPTIRKTALATLHAITGSSFPDAATWRTWAERHDLATIPTTAPAATAPAADADVVTPPARPD